METVPTKTFHTKDAIREMMPEQWKDDPAFLNLVDAIHSKAYMKLALHTIRKYAAYLKADRVEKLVHDEPRIIEKSLIGYLTNPKNNIRNGSKRVEFAVLKLLLVQNDVILNWSKISKVIGKRERNKNRGYTVEEIRRILNYAPDIRSKVIVLLLASTGVRIGALPALTLSNLKPIEHDGYKLYSITVYAGEPEEYVTFCTPECARAIDDYLDFRKRAKEVIKPSSPLIRDELDLETALAYPSRRVAAPMSVRGLEHMLRKIVEGSGIREALSKTIEEGTKVRYVVHLSRGFRKFFYTKLVEACVEPIHREYMFSHSDGSNNLDSTNLMMIYTTPENTDLFKSYLKAIDLLTINEINNLKKQVTELLEKANDVETLRREIKQLRNQVLMFKAITMNDLELFKKHASKDNPIVIKEEFCAELDELLQYE